MNTDRPFMNIGTLRDRNQNICVHLRSSADAFALVVALALTGCAIGPNYTKPETDVPASYKEAGDCVVAKPSAAAPKGRWREVLGDPVLDCLEEQVSVTAQSLAAAEARYRQAPHTCDSRRAGPFPSSR